MNITEGNNRTQISWLYAIDYEDANWIITSSFMIFTMQTGFGMLESGCVSIKNEVNIMMKNVVDIVLGGLTYWMFGYGLSFGRSDLSNGFIALGDFFLDPSLNDPLKGPMYTAFLFQLSFATTATTIVSGAMAESFLNTAIYCIPAGWIWGDQGFLKKMGAVDIAGSGAVHLIGGSAAFASAVMLGPRLGRYDNGTAPLPLGNPVNAVMGLFVLWWGWLAFNSGSTYGLSGAKWEYAARAAVMTMIATFGGGTVSIIYTLIRLNGKIDTIDIINGILGSLVSITGGCFLYKSWEALVVGTVGALLVCGSMPLFDKLGVDDPVGASSVHGIGGIWGILAIGIFADNPIPLGTTNDRIGLIKGGGWYLLGVQTLSAVCLLSWGVITTFILLWIINQFVTIRMDVHMELMGADIMEHLVRHGNVGVSRAVSAFRPVLDTTLIDGLNTVGLNPEHHKHVDAVKNLAKKRKYGLSKILRDITKNRNFGVNVAKKLIPRKSVKDKQLARQIANTMRATVTHPENEIKTQIAWIE